MAYKKGTDILIQIDTQVVHATISKSIDFATDMIECTNDNSTNEFKEFLPGNKGATINFEGVVEEGETTNYAIEDLIDAHIAGSSTALAFIYGGTTTGDMTVSGSGYLMSLNITGANNDRHIFSGSIQVTGAVTRGTVGP